MNKDQVVIEEGGVEYVFEKQCTKCVMKSSGGFCGTCEEMRPLTYRVCNELPSRWPCISATKIESEPKMYFAWNREDARRLVGREVEFHDGSVNAGWTKGVLRTIDSCGSPFCGGRNYGVMVREIPTIKLTLTELREKYGVPDNVVIVEGE